MEEGTKCDVDRYIEKMLFRKTEIDRQADRQADTQTGRDRKIERVTSRQSDSENVLFFSL